MPTATENLDLVAGIGQRQSSFRFALVEAASGRPLGNIAPVKAVSLQHDTTRKICRSVSGLVLDKTDTAAVNTLTDRVLIYMTTAGTEYPLGTYVFTDGHKSRTTNGRRGDYGLQDLGYVIAQPTETTVGFGATINVGEAIATVLDQVVLPEGYVVEATGAALGAPVAWPAGTDRGQILESLCRLGAYFSPYMSNDSVIRVRQAFDPAAEAPTFELAEGGRVRKDSISESDDLLEAPNAFIVIDNSNTTVPVVGRYDVPVSAPHSAANRGFVVPSIIDMQGIGSTANADAAARSIGLAQTIHEQVTLATPPDPRHDAYDVILYDDANWLETAWSMTLAEGADMTHTLTRAYAAGEASA